MSTSDVLPAPPINSSSFRDPKWELEYEAFLRMKHELLTTHRGQYVAIHDEQLVGSGDDQVQVALEAYQRFGYVPVYVGLVSETDQPPVRIPSPRTIIARV